MKWKLFLVPFVLLACGHAPDVSDGSENEGAAEADRESIVETVAQDSIPEIRQIAPPPDRRKEIDSWPLEKLIISCPKEMRKELMLLLAEERKEWSDVPNYLVATYKGNDFGDYLHILFQDEHGKRYDFGFGNNNFSELHLFDDDFQEFPELVGKKFRIIWEWKLSSFTCCSGEYEMVEAWWPSVVGITLITR